MTREEALKELAEWREQMKNHGVPDYGKKLTALGVAIEALENAPTENTNTSTDTPTNTPTDLISRQDVYHILEKEMIDRPLDSDRWVIRDIDKAIRSLQSAEPKTGEWTTEQVAEMLANLFGDECACNFNGIDEWLPLACKYADTQCPDPKEKHGCWMQFLIQGGGTGE